MQIFYSFSRKKLLSIVTIWFQNIGTYLTKIVVTDFVKQTHCLFSAYKLFVYAHKMQRSQLVSYTVSTLI